MKEIKNRQFKHAFHIPAKNDSKGNEITPDTLVIKELLVYEDGTKEDNLRKIVNATRPYYITKELYRNHKQKKEHELLSRVSEYKATQSNLEKEAIGKLKGMAYGGQINRRVMNRSPYIYGTDIHITELAKDKYDSVLSKGEKDMFSTTFFDIEYNIRQKQISLVTSIKLDPYNNKNLTINVYINTSKKGINICRDDLSKIESYVRREMEDKLPKNFMKDRNFKFDFYLNDEIISLLDTFWEHRHQEKSDFLTAWNVNYDINEIEGEYIKANEDFARRVTDPSLGDEYARYNKRIVPDLMITAGGVKKRIPPHRRWHTFRSPASFYIIDQMATYSYLRITDKAILGGYSLNNVLSKENGLVKMNFPHLEKLSSLTNKEWHIECSEQHPIEYVCYNIWDVILQLMLELKTKDLTSTLPVFVNKSSFDNFDSSSKYVADDFHFYALRNDRVLGTSIVSSPTEDFGDGLGRKGWTITLPPWPKYNARSGIMDGHIPYMMDSASLIDADNDVTAAYPNAASFGNISKDTTRAEILNITGLDNHKKWRTISSNRIQKIKELNISFFGGESSHVEYSEWFYDMPDQEEFLELAKEHFNIEEPVVNKGLTKDAISKLPKTKGDNKLIVKEDDDKIGAYYVKESKVNTIDGIDYYYNLKRDPFDVTKEEFENEEECSLKDAFDTLMGEYNKNKLNSENQIKLKLARPDEIISDKLKGKVMYTKTSQNPNYSKHRDKGIDMSNLYGYKKAMVVNKPKHIFTNHEFVEPNLDNLDILKAEPLYYGGSPRTIPLTSNAKRDARLSSEMEYYREIVNIANDNMKLETIVEFLD